MMRMELFRAIAFLFLSSTRSAAGEVTDEVG
jgi:hypothetical protein